ncbi:hypothetical protein FXF51_27115 [Nonomuraea sp. PA05]|uniref:CU044_2847 family protein n=1 Tax=Nonomuraea sp. PA05 TaxID=2604466 RepID=UPI0011D2F32E|nr:CU044_2847 family protein [Nonomuraea sp. PA05]TYB61752.1 hypothetical protein FXF51_27115 [Nonomuraea sp. PA05]
MKRFERVMLDTNETIWVAVTVDPADAGRSGGPRDVAIGTKRLKGFGETLRGIVSSVQKSIAEARPDEVSVEFGLEVGCQSGEILAALADVSTNATVTVTMTWNGRPVGGEIVQ